MKNKDKVLAAFLVSLGLFSTIQANMYVGSLSEVEKQTLFATSQGKPDTVQPAGPTRVLEDQNPKRLRSQIK